MNKIFRIVFNRETGRWVVASEIAKGRKKQGSGGATAAAVLLTGSLGGLMAVSSPSYAAVVVNGNPQEATVGCELMTDNATTTWTVSANAGNCLAPSLAGTASGQGNPGTNAVFYSSSLTNGQEDSLNLGGYLDVWKTATFHSGIDMSMQRITNLANGQGDYDAVNVLQLKGALQGLGGGAGINVTNGQVYTPSYTLANANAIAGTSGAATDVGMGFTKVDAALGKLNTSVYGGGGIKYFHVNSALADSVASGANAVAIGPAATTSGGNAVVIGNGANTVSGNAVAMGNNSKVVGAGSVAIGDSSYAFSTGTALGQSVALGASSNASGDYSTAVGGQALATNNAASAFGVNANASGQRGVAVGASAAAAGSYATAIGTLASAGAANSTALGTSANASAVNSVALGANSTTTATLTNAAYNPGSAALSGTASVANGEVSIGKSGSERRLTNLAAGSAATDAVNVSQLQAEDATVDQQGTDTAARLGGGSTYSATTGAISAPSYLLANANTIGGTSGAATDVGSGFSKVDAALGALNTTANKGFNLSADAGATSQNIAPGATVQFDAGSNATVSRTGSTITYGVVANPTFSGLITANGGLQVGAAQSIDMGGNKVTNVAAGTAATDAVNKSQLDAVATTAGGAMTFTGNDAVAGVVNRTLGQTLSIKGAASTAGTYSGNNLKTVTDPTNGAINVQMADAPTFGAVTVNAGGTGKISGVTAGTAATDAVNKGQLDALNAIVTKQGTDTASGLGGGAAYNSATGAVSAPSYLLANANTIGGTSGAATDVGSGFSKVDAALGALNTTANKGFNISADAGATSQNIAPGATVQFDAGSNATVSRTGSTITYGVVANPTFSGLITANGGLKVGASQSIDMGGNKVTNVAAGTAATDAVNKSQLDAVATTAGGAMTFTGNDATAGVVNRTLGQTLAIKGTASTAGTYSGNNVKTVTDPVTGTINVQMADSPTFGAVTVNAGGTGKITGVTDGTIASGSKDAVNGGQLYTTNQAVAQNTTAIDALDGRVTTAEGSISTLNTNVSNLDGRVTQNTTDIAGNTTSINSLQTVVNNLSSGTVGLVQQSAAGANLTVGKDTGGAAVDFTGTAGARKLINVEDGTIASASKDAVNGGQLYTTNQAVAQNTTAIGALDGRVTTAEGDISALDGRVSSNETSITTLNTNVSNLDSRVTTNEGDITTLKSDVTNIDGRVSSNETSISTLNTNVSNLDGRMTTVEGSVTSITNQLNTGEIGLVKQDAATRVITVAKDSDGGEVNFAGTAGARKLTGVADGNVAVDSKDAVNGGQLYTTNEAVAQNTTAIGALDGRMTTAEGDISALDGRVSSNEGSISTLNTNVSNLDGRVTTNEGDITTLKSDVTNIDGRVTNVEGSVNTITNQLSSGEIGLVQYDAAAQSVTVAKGLGGATVDFRNNSGVARRLKGVAAGAQDEDAANVAQLKNALGGTASYDPATGAYTGPVYTVTNADGSTSQVNGVGGAIDNIDARVYNNTTQIQNVSAQINSGTIGLVQQAGAGAKLTVGKDTDGTEVDFASASGAARSLTNVADGDVAAGSKDAVNGGQLHTVSTSVASAIGGGAQVNADGTVSAPTFNLSNADGTTTQVHSVGDAVTQIDGRVAKVEGGVATLSSQLEKGEVGLVKQDATTRQISVAKDSDGTSVSVAGTAGDRVITGVAAAKADNDAVNLGQLKAAGVLTASGESKSVMTYDNADKTSMTLGGTDATAPVAVHNVADGVADHDAVNVSQLNERLTRSTTEVVAQANAYTDQRIDDVWAGMDQVARKVMEEDRRINQHGAMSMAQAQMASGAAAAAVGNPNGAWSVGLGFEKGYGAISAGYAKPVGKKSQISFGAAFSGDERSVGMGFAHKL